MNDSGPGGGFQSPCGAIQRTAGHEVTRVERRPRSIDLHRQAREDLVRAASRSVSFVDRVSFAFMREQDIRLALAIDEDFSVEGFEILP